MTRALTLCILILAATCAAYAAGAQSTAHAANAPHATASAAQWTPMSFDIETSPPEDTYPPDEGTARYFEQ